MSFLPSAPASSEPPWSLTTPTTIDGPTKFSATPTAYLMLAVLPWLSLTNAKPATATVLPPAGNDLDSGSLQPGRNLAKPAPTASNRAQFSVLPENLAQPEAIQTADSIAPAPATVSATPPLSVDQDSNVAPSESDVATVKSTATTIPQSATPTPPETFAQIDFADRASTAPTPAPLGFDRPNPTPAAPILIAQSITPAADGTSTDVTSVGNRYDIQGGSFSSDQTNLFHSFQKFGLDANEIANFIANPQVRNILGRVTGGEASLVDGLVKVSGGNAPNLFLMNPAGLIFGTNARLDVPASFTATTANGIGFGNGWFNASDNMAGNSVYATLNGNPQTLGLTMNQPGAIVNAGQLAVAPGQSLTLVGGTVVNTGSLTATGGQLTIAAVPGTNLIRVSQPGNVLSLEIQPLASSAIGSPNAWQTPILLLPALLTGQSINTGLSVNGNNQVTLAGTAIATPPGSVVAAGNVDVSNPTSGMGGTVGVLGSTVGLFGVNVNASGRDSGGTLLIGGNAQGQGTLPTSDRTYVSSDSVLQADGLQGKGGQISVWGNSATAVYGNLSAQGSGGLSQGGFANIGSQQKLLFQGKANLNGQSAGTLLLNAPKLEVTSNVSPEDGNAILAGTADNSLFTIAQSSLADLPGNTNLRLEANNDVTIAPGSSPTFQPGSGSITIKANANTNSTGSFTMNADDSLITNGRSISIAGDQIDAGNITTTATNRSSGNLQLTAKNNVTTGNLRTDSDVGNGGSVQINTAAGSIKAGTLLSRSLNGNGGDIALTALGGTINYIGALDARSINGGGRGGNISLTTTTAPISVTANEVLTSGNIALNTTSGNITTSPTGGTINANGVNITTVDGNLDLKTNINTQAGGITIASTTSPIDTSQIRLTSDGGAVRLTTANQIKTSDIWTKGGAISLSGNTVDTQAGKLDASSSTRNGGAVTLSATGNLATGDIYTFSSASGGNGGLITLSNSFGKISTGSLNAFALAGGQGGNINILSSSSDLDLINNLGPIQTNGNIRLSSDLGNITTRTTPLAAKGITITTNTGAIGLGGDLNAQDGGITISSSTRPIDTQLIALTANRGAVTLTTGDRITTGNITTNGGNIRLTSQNSTIAAMGTLSSAANSDRGGDIILTAQGNLKTAGINSSSLMSDGGNVALSSQTGAIDATGMVNASSAKKQGGAITLDGQNDLKITSLNTTGVLAGGNITLLSRNGGIDAINTLDSTATNGSGGTMTLTAAQDVNTNKLTLGAVNPLQINTFGVVNLKDAITTQGANITIGNQILPSQINVLAPNATISTQGGNLAMSSRGAITVQTAVSTRGGNISANGKTIDSTSGLIDASNPNGNGGAIALTALGNLTTGAVDSSSTSAAGNTLTLTSQTGNVVSGALKSSGATSGGNIAVAASDRIQTGTVNASGRTKGGNVDFSNQTGGMTVAAIDTASITGQGGKVALSGNSGDIVVGNIKSSSQTQDAGTITVNSQTGRIISGALESSGATSGGNIAVTAGDRIQTGTVNASGRAKGGNVDFSNQTGGMIVSAIDAASITGQGGKVMLSGNSGDILVGNIKSSSQTQDAGAITVTNNIGNINTALLDASSTAGKGGTIALSTKVGNLTTDQIQTFSTLNQGGNVSLTSTQGNINTPGINTSSKLGQAGNVALSVDTGNITANQLNAASESGNGGTVNVTTKTGNLDVGQVQTLSNEGQGGAVTLTTNRGDITATTIDASSQQADGGTVRFTANNTRLNGDISTTNRDIIFNSNLNLGNTVSLGLGTGTQVGTARFNGTVNAVTAGQQGLATQGNAIFNGVVGTTPLRFLTVTGTTAINSLAITTTDNQIYGDKVTLGADAALTGSDLAFRSTLDSDATPRQLTAIATRGNIAFDRAVGSQSPLASLVGSAASHITADDITTQSGETTLTGAGVTVGQVQTNSGPITLMATQTDLAAKGNLDSTALNGKSGAITVTAKRNITTRSVNTSSQLGSASPIRVSSETGAIVSDDFNATAQSEGGAITIAASGNVTARSVDTTSRTGAAGNITALSGGSVTNGDFTAAGITTGGKITVSAGDRITAGRINSSASVGNGGAVTLDPRNDIQIAYVNAQGGTQGIGGEVNAVTQRFFRATDTFTDQNGQLASISTAGGRGGSPITLFHGGASTPGIYGKLTPFFVGRASENSTAGALTVGTGRLNTIAPNRVFVDSFTQKDIRILTNGPRLATMLQEESTHLSCVPDDLLETLNGTVRPVLDLELTDSDSAKLLTRFKAARKTCQQRSLLQK